MQLVIVESPTKAKTIQKFLSSDYVVLSSFGHIRDLPKSDLAIDVEHNFEPRYVIPTKARSRVSELKKEAAKTDRVILATDEDREGEAIAWHLAQALGLSEVKNKKSRQGPASPKLQRGERGSPQAAKIKNVERIVFHEITKSAIENALKNPREIDMNLVDAQQARRVLDRLVGYKLSPFLWKKIARGLSAGRVQSVTVRLIVDREREVERFEPGEYWSIEARLQKTTNHNQQAPNKPQIQNLKDTNTNIFLASLYKKNNEVISRLGIKDKKEAEKILKDLEGAEYKVGNIERKETRRNPAPPLTTSTLQQEAARRFGMPAKITMSIAQSLYEQGYITYHRTDSLNLSEQSLEAAKQFIEKEFGQNYYSKRTFKTKSKGAQEAHEAIRPAFAQKTPNSLKLDARQKKFYELIWSRFIASQMSQAIFDATTIDIEAKRDQVPLAGPGPASQIYTFRANGSILKFAGFLKVYPMKFEENELPELSTEEILELIKLTPSQHFTQPPARYSEATLIKELEKNGIGRPSTYAPTISTIQQRNYVEKNEQKKFAPTEIGITVNDLLMEHFPKIVDIQFTAEMEEDLDKIAHGEKQWVSVIKIFYEPFAELLEKKYEEVQKKEVTQEATDKICPSCGKNLITRFGRFGKFYACPGFPDCKYTEPLEKKETALGIKCPKCLEGDIVEKRTRKKKTFYGCNKYPACDFALWDKPINEHCEKCGSLLVEKTSQGSNEVKIKCSNKECR